MVAPTAGGGTTWWSPAYSPRTGLLYVNAFDGEGQFFVRDEQYEAGERYTGGDVNANPMTYAVGGAQYVTMAVGNTVYTFGLHE